MRVQGLGWVGVRTAQRAALTDFATDVLGLTAGYSDDHMTAFDLPDGSQLEIFGADFVGKEHLSTGPVVGFWVDDLPDATAELIAAGIELLGVPGPSWQHFRGPDGLVYELKATARPS